MGSACCVAAKEKNASTGSRNDVVLRNTRHSPTWSFRWENRGRVAGEETSISWFSDSGSRNGGSDIKYESNCISAYESPSNSLSRQILHKSPSEMTSVHETPSISERTMDTISDDVTEQSFSKLSTCALHSSSSLSTSPATKWRWSSKGSDYRVQENSFSVTCGKPLVPPWRSDSARPSWGGSSGSWSVNTIPEVVSARRDNFCVDNDSAGYDVCEGSRISGCGICRKVMGEYSVVAVLVCGHSYHTECLEILTCEARKYDPACPICAFGESDGPKSASTSGLKPFLARNFSFGLRNQSSKKKGFFLSRSLNA